MRLRYRILLASVLISILLLSGALLLSVERTLQRERATRALVKAVWDDDNTPAALKALSDGADPNATTAAASPPLTFWQAVLKLVHPIQSRPITTDASGPVFPVLVWAARQQDEAIVNSLLKHGAYVNAHDTLGTTPLMRASLTGDAPVLTLLLAHGAQVNVRDDDGETALMLAVWDNHTSAVALLLQAGAEVNVRDNDGNTALGYVEDGNTDAAVIRLLKQAGGHR